MSDNKKVWQPLQPNIELSEEQFFNEWFALESKFGEYGTPGISEVYTNSRFPSINTVDNRADIRWTLYRDESGKLLGIYGSYTNKDNFEQAFSLSVHPDHQRQGIATLMIEHNVARHERELGRPVDYEQTIPNKVTQAGVNFVNKFVQNAYNKE